MTTYRADDPRLDQVMQELAEEEAAHWPPPTEQQRARLASLLATPQPRPVHARPRTPFQDVA